MWRNLFTNEEAADGVLLVSFEERGRQARFEGHRELVGGRWLPLETAVVLEQAGFFEIGIAEIQVELEPTPHDFVKRLLRLDRVLERQLARPVFDALPWMSIPSEPTFKSNAVTPPVLFRF
jgi:hypothetical protein